MPPILCFAIYVLSSLGVAAYGRNRKFGYWGYFFASLLLSPLIGTLLVVSADDPPKKLKEKKENKAEEIQEDLA